MFHNLDSDTMDMIYSKVGRAILAHNSVEETIEQICCAVWPEHLYGRLVEFNSTHTFSDKLKHAHKLLRNSGALNSTLLKKFETLASEIRNLNGQRNLLVHSRLEIRALPNDDETDQVWYAFFQARKIRKISDVLQIKAIILDTSEISLDDLLESYGRLQVELDSFLGDIDERLHPEDYQ